MRATILILLLLIASTPTFAQDEFWKDEHGNRVPDTASQKSINGVGGWLLVTSDEDWEAKWNTPAETIPHFTEADTVLVGKRLFVLVFIGGPGRAKNGNINVTCDMEVQRPDGTYSTRHRDGDCLKGPLKGPTSTLYLSELVLGFIGEENDPRGKWIVRITIKDNFRHVTIPLETSFTLQ